MPVPAIIAGGAALGSALMSGLFGSSSQKSANETNIMLTRETNAQNRELYEMEAARQNQWNERQYEEYWKQRAYDSPANQRAQYEQAGVNPYFALSNIQTGQAAGSTPTPTGSATPPSMVPAHVEPYDPSEVIMQGGHGVAAAVNSYFDNKYKAAETERTMIENLTRYDESISRIKEAYSRVNKNSAEAAQMRTQLEILQKAKTDIIASYSKSNKVLDEQAKDLQGSQNERRERTQLIAAQTYAQDLHNSLFVNTAYWQQKAMELTCKELDSRINLNSASAAAAYADSLVKKAEEIGIKWSNDQKERLKETLDDAYRLQNKMMKQDLGTEGGAFAGKYNVWRTVVQGLITGASAAAGAYAGAAGRVGAMNRIATPYHGTRIGFTGTGVAR